MMSVKTMKKQSDGVTVDSDELRPHYDFDYRMAKPNRFAARLSEETIVVVLDPDVAAVFNTSEAVNEALRVFITAFGNLAETPNLGDRERSEG